MVFALWRDSATRTKLRSRTSLRPSPSFELGFTIMKDKAMRIGLLNHIGGGNLGDEATLGAVLQNIKTRWPHAEMVAFTMNPENSELRHGIPSYPLRRQTWTIKCDPGPEKSAAKTSRKKTLRSALSRFKFLNWCAKKVYALTFRLPVTLIRELRFLNASRKLIRALDILVISGGGQLTERDGPWAFPYTLWKWVLLSRSCNVETIFLNVGAGPLMSRLGKTFTRRALDAAEYVSFRDTESQVLVREIGFAGRSSIVHDSVYSLQCPSFAFSPANPGTRLRVGFAAVPFGDPRLHPKEKDSVVYDRFLDKCIKIINGLVNQGYLVTLFGTDVGVDALVNADILARLREQGAVTLPEYAEVETVEGLLRVMSAMDYIVTCRFHGVIFAHLLNKPVLAIAHHPKVTHLMNGLGLSEYCVDIQGFDPVRLMDTFTALVGNSEAVKKSMAANFVDYRAKLTAQFDGLFPPGSAQADVPKQSERDYCESRP
jgi:polysaccharide pyruvyl transferase WcaK-like protein